MLDKIKVLHIIKTLNLGGAEMNLLNIVKATDRTCVELHVAYSYGGELEPNFKEAGVQLFKFADQDQKLQSLATPGIIMRLAGYIRQNHIDIVHTHTFYAEIWGAVAAKLAGCKIIEHVHDLRYESKEFLNSRGMEPVKGHQLMKFFAKLPDRIIVLTKANQDYLHHLGITDAKIRRLLNGINLESGQQPSRLETLKKFGIAADRPIILAALRLSPEKNAKFILDIAVLVKTKHPQSCFLIAGDGPQMQELKELALKQNLQQHVIFIGYHPKVIELMAASDLFILPTLRELHSISMIEAMSMKLPVLVSQGAGCNDEFIKHGEDGFVLDPYKPQDWAEVINRLLDDASLRAKIGASALKKVQDQCDIKHVAQNIQQVYKEVVHA